jgi:hypothetical protein
MDTICESEAALYMITALICYLSALETLSVEDGGA